MGVATVYTCDIGSETTEDPTGWMTFQIQGVPVGGGPITAFTPALVCPAHLQHVLNVVELGFSNLRPVAGSTVPAAPTNVAAVANGGSSVTVTWTAPADGGSPISGYLVKSVPDGAQVNVLTSSATLTGLTVGNSYNFTVAAVNAVGWSTTAESAPVTVS